MSCEDALRLEDAREIHWLGIDYSAVQMVGRHAFQNPDAIFPGFLHAWNEFIGDDPLLIPKMRSGVGARVIWGAGAMVPVNEAVTKDRIVARGDFKGRSITPDRLADMVEGYEITAKTGVGLVFAMDHMVKEKESACLYVTFFDLASRSVLQSQRVCGDARGWGFRNYWLGPIKDAVASLFRIRRMRLLFIREQRCRKDARPQVRPRHGP